MMLYSCQPDKEIDNPGRPNIILFLIDDYGYADISAEGNTQIKTPNIDRIADQGARFNHFYQCSGACAPTRASLLTGRYYLETGVWGVHYGRDFLRRDETTIGDILQSAGYTTGAFGKWHSGKTWSYCSWNRGFDVGVQSKLYRYWDAQILFNNKVINFKGPVTDIVADQVVKFIEDNKEDPFFAYVPFQSIHEPFNCPPDVFRNYKDLGYSDHVARLYGMIEVLDDNIGKILNRVNELNLTDNTVVMFLVDDGPSPGCDVSYSNRRMNAEEKAERSRGWGRQLRGGKASIWEGGSISPFYIMWKGKIMAGSNFDNLSGVIDLLPTIADMCGADIPVDNLPIRGQSFWPILQGQDLPELKDRKYFDNTNFYKVPRWKINMDRPEMWHMSVHYKDYKLIRSDRTLFGEEGVIKHALFNLLEDSKEENNLFNSLPEVASELDQSVVEWYDNIVKGGRAFPQAVYEVGNWEDRQSAINLDGVKEVKGSSMIDNPLSPRTKGWNEPGNSMMFEIDVVQEGKYIVELLYNCTENPLGSEFNVYTQHASGIVKIEDPRSAISEAVNLPAGRQQLTVEVKNITGQSAVDVMNMIIVNRIPGSGDMGVLQNPGFKSEAGNETIGEFGIYCGATDFMTHGGLDETLQVKHGSTIRVVPFADNSSQIAEVEFFKDFETVGRKNNPPYEFEFTLDEKDNFTLNVEFTSKEGVKNAARVYLEAI